MTKYRWNCSDSHAGCANRAVRFEGVSLELLADWHRAHCMKARMKVRRHDDGTLSIWHGPSGWRGTPPRANCWRTATWPPSRSPAEARTTLASIADRREAILRYGQRQSLARARRSKTGHFYLLLTP